MTCGSSFTLRCGVLIPMEWATLGVVMFVTPTALHGGPIPREYGASQTGVGARVCEVVLSTFTLRRDVDFE